ncbi:unnamed protein product [Dovyalis caffra]|uniref:Uncharacterized protein n=1 Tax=Dovyalis caffra TaxID=77055 RepID=A0AAV1S993_9ROSI|nr:unnamed protein product [Dovyalis caffra]
MDQNADCEKQNRAANALTISCSHRDLKKWGYSAVGSPISPLSQTLIDSGYDYLRRGRDLVRGGRGRFLGSGTRKERVNRIPLPVGGELTQSTRTWASVSGRPGS